MDFCKNDTGQNDRDHNSVRYLDDNVSCLPENGVGQVHGPRLTVVAVTNGLGQRVHQRVHVELVGAVVRRHSKDQVDGGADGRLMCDVQTNCDLGLLVIRSRCVCCVIGKG